MEAREDARRFRLDKPLSHFHAIGDKFSQNNWDIPANIEYEYKGDDTVAEVRCVEYCKQALA